MNLLELFICFWVLPSLVSALITIRYAAWARDPIKRWNQTSWKWFWIFTVIYPTVIVLIICWPAELIRDLAEDIKLRRLTRRSML
jgi:succinate dehydrogenase/fumarate reductase cytochrome b subunit